MYICAHIKAIDLSSVTRQCSVHNIGDSILFHSSIRHQSNWRSDGAVILISVLSFAYSALECEKLDDSYVFSASPNWPPNAIKFSFPAYEWSGEMRVQSTSAATMSIHNRTVRRRWLPPMVAVRFVCQILCVRVSCARRKKKYSQAHTFTRMHTHTYAEWIASKLHWKSFARARASVHSILIQAAAVRWRSLLSHIQFVPSL